MSVLPNATFISPGNSFYGQGNGSIPSTINANTINVSTLNALLINNSSINVGTIDVDGQILTANGTELLLNGIPIATTANLSSIADWALYPAVSTVLMNNENLSNVDNIYFQVSPGNPSVQLEANVEGTALFINGQPITAGNAGNTTNWSQYPASQDVNVAQYNLNNVKNISSSGIVGGTQFNVNNTGGKAILTTDVTGTNLLVNGAVVATGGSASNWSQYPANTNVDMSYNALLNTRSLNLISSITATGNGTLAVNDDGTQLLFNGSTITTGGGGSASNWSAYPATQIVDMASNSLSNVGSFLMPASVTSGFSLGGGSIVTPIASNKQYALTTNIVNVSPLTPMEITSAGGINMTANATTGTQEFNITFVGVSGNDMNITAPDINLTCTDATSFMNLTAPAGVTIAGGGLFIASGGIEAIGIGDITLVSAGNVSIGSGNVAGADTEIEKFAFNDCNVEPTNGIRRLLLNQIEIKNVRRDAGSEGIFLGNYLVACEIDATTTITSYNSNTQQVRFRVQADQGTSVYKAMTLTSIGTGTIQFNMEANGTILSQTYNSGNLLTFGSTGGDVQLAGVGTINASAQLSAPVGSFSTLNISSISANTISASTIGVSSIVGDYGQFSTLRTNATIITLGENAGTSNQADGSIAIGYNSGNSDQQGIAIAIGYNAGSNTQGAGAIAIGLNAGADLQSSNAVAIGNSAGKNFLGANSIAIGDQASLNAGSFSNTIVLNATGVELSPAQASSAYIKPIRDISVVPSDTAFTMAYVSTTGELLQTDTKVSEVQSTIQNTSQITYNTGLLTTTIDGLLTVNGGATFTQNVDMDTTLNVLQSITASTITTGLLNYTTLNPPFPSAQVLSQSGNNVNLSGGGGSVNIATTTQVATNTTKLTNVSYAGGNTTILGDTYTGNQFVSGAINAGSNLITAGSLNITQDANVSSIVGNSGSFGILRTSANNIALGNGAGSVSQGANAIAIGSFTGAVSAGIDSIAIGNSAGYSFLGQNSIVIGRVADAGQSNTIVINATGGSLVGGTANSCYIAPMRVVQDSNAYQNSLMMYNTTTKEVGYGTSAYGFEILTTSSTAFPLTPIMRGRTIALVGGTSPQPFSTAALGANDAGFFVIVHNSSGLNGGDYTLTATPGSLAGVDIVHEQKNTFNGGSAYLYWDGTTLTGY